MPDGPEALLRHFRTAFAADPIAAYRDWFRAQEDLRESGDAGTARALADDLWESKETLPFATAEARARFLHNLAVFFGSAGPAASLRRAREAFSAALTHFESGGDEDWRARSFHNFATALSNLGETGKDLEESVALFERALAWRTAEREIARGVTLHNMGRALERWTQVDPSGGVGRLERAAAALSEAVDIRTRHRLAEGRALSLFHLAMTLEALRRPDAARTAYETAAEEFERLGKSDSAAVARMRLEALVAALESEA